jgi:hypothetical protein
MFVRYSCGCIGIPLSDTRGVIVSACDEERDTPRDSLSWGVRLMLDTAYIGKTFTALPEREETALYTRLGQRLASADRYDIARRALGIA